MKKKTTEEHEASRVCWESLEEWARLKLQGWLQGLLEEEVTELLGRRKSERRAVVEAPEGYRNGHGKERKLTFSCGTVTVRRPRVRGLEERFVSSLLPLFSRRTKAVNELLPELYLHGLAQGDFDLAVRGLLGEDAPVSASTIARLTEKWQDEQKEWAKRRLDDLEPVYMWADGVYVKAGLEKEKAALLVVIVGLADGRKEFVAVAAGHRESKESWAAVLRDLRDRGLRAPRLVVADGHLGLWAGLREIFPEADEQRCWNHRVLNVLDKLAKKHQSQARMMLRAIPCADTADEATRLKTKFQKWCRQRAQNDAAELIDHDWDRLLTFYRYPRAHWKHLRTSNVIESPFAALRLRTDAAKRFKKVSSATAVIYKMLLVAQQKFRKLNAPELLKDVLRGVKYIDGERVIKTNREAAA